MKYTDPFKEIDNITMRNLDLNKSKLYDLKSKLENYLKNKNTENYLSNLYSSNIDDLWFNAQCKSACNQIDKVINKKSEFNVFYKKNLTKSDLLLLTKELIFDISLLDQISNHRLKLKNKIRRDNHLSSNQFFLHAKFSIFTNKPIVNINSRNFNFSTMPTLIRQSIEIKLKNMIGLKKVEKINGGFKFITTNSLLIFFKKHPKLLDFPICLDLLKSINTWTNTFIHTGVIPFSWQSLEAVDQIEALFSIKDEKLNLLSLDGFTYLKNGVTIADIQSSLSKHFNAKFTLSEKNVEGILA